jgi:MFS family permease
VLWIIAALLFASLSEEPGATEGGRNALMVAVSQFRLLRKDPQLARFTVVRCLLLAIPLAPPFLVTLEGRTSGAPGVELGPLVVAAALATISSSYVWGRLADKSSRRVLGGSACIGAVGLAVAATIGAGIGERAGLTITSIFLLPALVFVLTIAEQGVRLGRGTHVVDMADAESRGAYTALSNTISGVVMLCAGVFGIFDQMFGGVTVLVLFGGMCVAAGWMASRLEEVQQG